MIYFLQQNCYFDNFQSRKTVSNILCALKIDIFQSKTHILDLWTYKMYTIHFKYCIFSKYYMFVQKIFCFDNFQLRKTIRNILCAVKIDILQIKNTYFGFSDIQRVIPSTVRTKFCPNMIGFTYVFVLLSVKNNSLHYSVFLEKMTFFRKKK